MLLEVRIKTMSGLSFGRFLHAGPELCRIKPIAVFEIFTDQTTLDYLALCEKHKQHTRHAAKRLALVEAHLGLCRPLLYLQIPQGTRDWLKHLRASLVLKTNYNEPMGPVAQEICKLLKLHAVDFATRLVAGPLVLDIYNRNANVIYEVCPRHQFYANTSVFTATAKRRHELIVAMGFKLILVPERKWLQLCSNDEKLAMLKI
ncbi:RAP domain [Babesia duncani]|uniref:RAP domain n=1 Tax=Babesia duncani TaxID=323732 RepID=A0AAD9PP42_9APIC|nr:RAP domain [Babesia duncani]